MILKIGRLCIEAVPCINEAGWDFAWGPAFHRQMNSLVLSFCLFQLCFWLEDDDEDENGGNDGPDDGHHMAPLPMNHAEWSALYLGRWPAPTDVVPERTGTIVFSVDPTNGHITLDRLRAAELWKVDPGPPGDAGQTPPLYRVPPSDVARAAAERRLLAFHEDDRAWLEDLLHER